MSVAERNDPSIEYMRVPLEFPDGTKPRLLFRVVGLPAPSIYTVCIVVDCSDSYRDGIKELGALRRAIAPFPANWPVHFFKLSNTELVATQTISEFCFGEAHVERILENELSEIPSQFRGSFLRPCVESIAAIRSTELHPTDRLVFVLSDGQFTDFRPILPPDWMTLRVVSNSAPANGVSTLSN